MKIPPFPRTISMVFACLFLAAAASHGATYTWTGATADWATASNWTPGGGPPVLGDTARFNAASSSGNLTPTFAASTSTTIKGINAQSSTQSFAFTGAGVNSSTLALDVQLTGSTGGNYIDNRFGGVTDLSFNNMTLVLTNSSGGTGQYKVLMSEGDSVTVANNSKLQINNTIYVESQDTTGNANFNINGELVITNPATVIHVDNKGVSMNFNFTSATGMDNLTTTVSQGGGSSGGGTINFMASGDYGNGISRYANDGGSLATSGTYNVAASGITVSNRTLTFNNNEAANQGKFGTFGATYASGTSTYAGNVVLADAFNLAGAKINALNVTNSAATLVISGLVSGGDISFLTVNKTGLGTLNLSNATGNTFLASSFNVTEGTLRVTNTSGSATGTTAVNVSSAAILAGNGRITGVTTVSGIVAPGNSIGTLTVANDVIWNGGASASSATDWQFELGAGNTADLLDITGGSSDFLKGTGSVFRFDFLGGTSVGTFKIVDWGGSTTFNIGDFSYTNLGSGRTGGFQFNGSQLEFVAVPEPQTWALLAAGALGAILLRRRKVS